MYNNVGGILKRLAIFICVLGIIGSVISGFSTMALGEELVGYGFLILLLGSLGSWLSSLSLYAFGSLVENSNETRETCQSINHKLDILIKVASSSAAKEGAKTNDSQATAPNTPENPQKSVPAQHWLRCKRCGGKITTYPCAHCGLSNLPIKVYRSEKGTLTCPACKTVQNGDHYHCKACGQPFINGQPNIPFWCGKCGAPGPYEGACPTCGSNMKLMNN